MLTITLILAVAAMILTIWHAANGQVPLWVPVLLICICILLPLIPVK